MLYNDILKFGWKEKIETIYLSKNCYVNELIMEQENVISH